MIYDFSSYVQYVFNHSMYNIKYRTLVVINLINFHTQFCPFFDMKIKSKSLSNHNYIFNTCASQKHLPKRSQQKVTYEFNPRQRRKMKNYKTSSKPISFQQIVTKRQIPRNHRQTFHNHEQGHGLITKDTRISHQINQPKILQSFHRQPNSQRLSLGYSLSDSGHKSNRSIGQKIKIFSNDRGKSFSRQSKATSKSQQKRGIQVTKTLFKKISVMYSDKDFDETQQCSRQNYNNNHNYSRKQTLKINKQVGRVQRKHSPNKSYNHTDSGNRRLMTTWDGQGTINDTINDEYQLSNDFSMTYNNLNNSNRYDKYGSLGNILNASGQSTYTNAQSQNTHNNSSNNNRYINDQQRYIIQKQRENNAFTQNKKQQRYSSGSLNRDHSISNINHNNPFINHHTYKEEYSMKNDPTSIYMTQMIENSQHNQTQNLYFHNAQKHQNQNNKPNKQILESNFPQKQKEFSSSKKLKNLSSNSENNLKKSSLIFSKKKKDPSQKIMFQTAHQILSQDVSQFGSSANPSSYRAKGQQLTHALYGSKKLSQIEKMQEMSQEQRQKYILKYKNKTFDDLSVKQSMISGYDNYYYQ